MKKRRQHILLLLTIVGFLGILGFGILLSKGGSGQKNESTPIQGVSKKIDINASGTKKSLSDLDALVEIPNVKDAVVMEVTDQKMIREFDPLFGRVYKGDLIVFLPDQTIVYDTTTKTVRDIISTSFYEEVKK